LVALLRNKYGVDNVIASGMLKTNIFFGRTSNHQTHYLPHSIWLADIKVPPSNFPAGPFLYCDVLNQESLTRTVVDHRIDWVIHLASLLSAVGERNPQVLHWDRVNMYPRVMGDDLCF
jgi:UDP-glucose 4-epimerase